MNLVGGQIVTQAESQRILDTMSDRILSTLSREALNPKTVIEACDKLVHSMDDSAYLITMAKLGIGTEMGTRYLHEAKAMFNRDSLQARLVAELGPDYGQERKFTPLFGAESVRERLEPLGVLLHIAAGNADGLPAFSVLEGLLTGNINILKLPQVDGDLSVNLLLELIRIEPTLADYIYVFDYSSKDIVSIGKLMELADGVVVWGGDIAVSALRKAVKPNTKLIEWGHKVSFAYVTKQGATSEALEGLARHICETNGLLCSSCQGIYISSDDVQDVFEFCKQFLPILEKATMEIPSSTSVGMRAQITLQLYTLELEQKLVSKVFRGKGCSLMALENSNLETSIQFRNLWVKPLPKEKLLTTLRPHKNHLQTAGLLCGAQERDFLTRLLWKAGIVRVTSGNDMSSSYLAEPHDGQYPLRHYVRIVSAW